MRFGAFFFAGWRGAREGIKGREPRKKKKRLYVGFRPRIDRRDFRSAKNKYIIKLGVLLDRLS